MTTTETVTILEHALVAPPPGQLSERSLPLTFCDIIWIGFFPIQRLVFYESPVSRSHFVNNIIPELKTSLSVTLKYFWALAGNLIIPPNDSGTANISYNPGDSVSMLFAESSSRGFDYLTGNQPRDCLEFHPLIPQLPESHESSGSKIVPLIALQVTLFLEAGISIGFSNQHVGGDGTTVYSFMKAWAMFSKLGSETVLTVSEGLPVYDRDVMNETKGIDDLVWERMRDRIKDANHDQVLPQDPDKVRATFVVGPENARRLKKYVSERKPSLKHLSTFTAACAYVWTCLVKSGNATKTEVVEDETENFVFMVDCRGRGDQPIPENYSGNCILPCLVSTANRHLSGEGGFPAAAELIGEKIHQTLRRQRMFSDIEELFKGFSKVRPETSVGVAGSPKHNYYNIDFGWGKPIKFEFVSIDKTGAIGLCGCRDSGGLEIGLALSTTRMDAFTSFFYDGLEIM